MNKNAWVIYWDSRMDEVLEFVALNEEDALELLMSLVEEEMYVNFLWACEVEYVEEWSAEDNYKYLSDIAYKLSIEDSYYYVEEVPCI